MRQKYWLVSCLLQGMEPVVVEFPLVAEILISPDPVQGSLIFFCIFKIPKDEGESNPVEEKRQKQGLDFFRSLHRNAAVDVDAVDEVLHLQELPEIDDDGGDAPDRHEDRDDQIRQIPSQNCPGAGG